MAQPVIIEAVRTPIGKRNGWLSGLRAPDLLGAAQVEVVKRAGIDPASVEQVVGGCVTQAGEQGFNVTRTAWLLAGLPYDVAATTIDCQCGSSQQANHMVNNLIAAGRGGHDDRLRRRDDEPDPARGQRLGAGRRAGPPRRPALRHARASSRRPSGSPRSTASPARTSTAFGLESQKKAARALAEDRFAREIFAVEAPIVGEEGPRGEHSRREDGRVQGPGPARHDARGPGQAEAGAARRHAHRGDLVADLRRRRGRAVDVRGAGQGRGPPAPGEDRGPGAGGLRPLLPPRRSDRRRRPRCWPRPA